MIFRTRRVFIKWWKVATLNFLLWAPVFSVSMTVKEPWKYLLVLMTGAVLFPNITLKGPHILGHQSGNFQLSIHYNVFMKRTIQVKSFSPFVKQDDFWREAKKKKTKQWCTGPDWKNQRPIQCQNLTGNWEDGCWCLCPSQCQTMKYVNFSPCRQGMRRSMHEPMSSDCTPTTIRAMWGLFWSNT